VKQANREVLDRGSLPEILANRARHVSDRRLVLDVAVGLTAAAAIAVLRPPLWLPLAALAFCLVAFGLWGILDREVSDASTVGRRAKVLAFTRNVVAAAGGALAVFCGLTFFFAFLGYWKS
jgi:hypothetical protein